MFTVALPFVCFVFSFVALCSLCFAVGETENKQHYSKPTKRAHHTNTINNKTAPTTTKRNNNTTKQKQQKQQRSTKTWRTKTKQQRNRNTNKHNWTTNHNKNDTRTDRRHNTSVPCQWIWPVLRASGRNVNLCLCDCFEQERHQTKYTREWVSCDACVLRCKSRHSPAARSSRNQKIPLLHAMACNQHTLSIAPGPTAVFHARNSTTQTIYCPTRKIAKTTECQLPLNVQAAHII